MTPYIWAVLMLTLGLGTTITFSSSHWLLAWVGLEINTLAIIPLMIRTSHPRAVEATAKYFLAQATAAATLLFAGATNAWLTGQWNISLALHPMPGTLVILALSLKLGLAPLHTWLPEVLQGLTLTTGLILSTWQKLAPFSLLIQLPFQDHHLIFALGLTSMAVGGWGGLNQTHLRKVLAYSSIAHMGWALIVSQLASPLALLALTTYIIMTSTAFLALKLMGSLTINSLATSWTKSPVLASMFALVLLSLGGLPPLTGFLPKLLVLDHLVKETLTPLAMFAAFAALLSLYFYLRISYSLALTISPNNLSATQAWRLQTFSRSSFLASTTTTSLVLLPLAPAIVSIHL
uniref:NADH-ubiquinone oxidoreductase chain 2 n=1 Tax=Eviota japonica TaxID=1828451 RepID=A0A5K7TNR2_9GOBI|nr:NADH dehydrogenase subunit 2 [Eviota japonica]